MRKNQNLSAVKLIGIIIASIVYCIFIILLCRYSPCDSDKSNHLLQAKDIIGGNFFLRDWNLTGVTFLTTDLLFYEAAYILCGLNFRAICVAGGLMISLTMIVSLWSAIYDCSRDFRFRVGLFAVLAMIPCQYLIKNLRVHGGAIILCVLNFLFVAYIIDNSKQDNSNVKWYVLIFIACCLGSFGDMLTIIEGAIPISILCLYRIIVEDNPKYKEYRNIFISVAAGTGVGIVSEKLYFLIGGANKNSYIGDRSLTLVTEWPEKTRDFADDLMQLCFADFGGNSINDYNNIPHFFLFLICAVSLAYVIKIIIHFVKKDIDNIDTVSLLFTLGICVSFFCYIFTEMSQPRYIAIIPLGLSVIFIRNIEWMLNGIQKRTIFCILLVVISLVGAFGKIEDVIKAGYPESNIRNYQLVEFLESHDLMQGYASFWNASDLTVLSGESVRVRHIERRDEYYDMYNWFNKNQWYREESNFILIDNSMDDRGETDWAGVSEDGVIAVFGTPTREYEVSGYIILVYDYDLSKKLLMNNI